MKQLVMIAAIFTCIAAAPVTTRRANLDIKLTIQGRQERPTVYIDRDDIARAKTNRETSWGKVAAEKLLMAADEWAAKSDEQLRSYIPPPGACFAYGFSGCPICGAQIGDWWGAKASSLDDPGHVKCNNGHRLPDADHPDSGEGWTDPAGKKFYFVGEYNSYVIDTLTTALTKLVHAHALTGESKYAEKAAIIFDELGRIYPSCDKGSWDYPSSPPSGRFNRPWYQVARMLVHYANHYDILLMGEALEHPSSVQGMTRRQNIENNLLLNGAKYCYEQSIAHPALHNGQCDYIRGCMAVGVAMGIPEYVKWAVDGPWSIRSMLENNIDRDGQYYETSALYSHHTRYLYMDVAEIVRNYRDENYPNGVHLVDNPKFRAFYILPQSRITVAGHLAALGDDGPDTARVEPGHKPSKADLTHLENLRALTRDADQKRELGYLLHQSCDGDLTKTRMTAQDSDWLLFHADEAELQPTTKPIVFVHPLTQQGLSASDLLTQKGVAILRSGDGEHARGLTLRFGPTLNHGHFDEMNLNIYAQGYQLTYDLGYGLGSTHTQVGWAKQTASHNTVLVNEKSQLQAPGAGGTIERFLDLPGLKLASADDPACYGSEKVSRYARTVAMIDASPEASYIVDIFRVIGGSKHDYVFHAQGTKLATEGSKPSEPQPGSLAGTDVNWGARIGVDGDVKEIPNKPYWNPPPGNGLGFLMSPRTSPAEGQWSAEWTVDEKNPARLRLTMLPLANARVTLAEAPGILPKSPRSAYIFARRSGEDLASTFAAVIEPFADKRVVRSIESLTDPLHDADGAVAIKISLTDGRTDYFCQITDGKTREFAGIKLNGGFAKVRVDANGVREMTLIGGTSLSAFGIELSLPQARYDGVIDRIDFDKNILYTSTPIEAENFTGQLITIGSPKYAQRSAYRIARVERNGEMTAIHLLPTTMLLGRGHLETDPVKPDVLPNIVPLEYAKTVTRKASGFFRGKILTTRDGRVSTRIRDVAGTDGMDIEVESSEGYRAGDELMIYDVQPGDSFSIACFAQLQRQVDGRMKIESNARAATSAK